MAIGLGIGTAGNRHLLARHTMEPGGWGQCRSSAMGGNNHLEPELACRLQGRVQGSATLQGEPHIAGGHQTPILLQGPGPDVLQMQVGVGSAAGLQPRPLRIGWRTAPLHQKHQVGSVGGGLAIGTGATPRRLRLRERLQKGLDGPKGVGQTGLETKIDALHHQLGCQRQLMAAADLQPQRRSTAAQGCGQRGQRRQELQTGVAVPARQHRRQADLLRGSGRPDPIHERQQGRPGLGPMPTDPEPGRQVEPIPERLQPCLQHPAGMLRRRQTHQVDRIGTSLTGRLQKRHRQASSLQPVAEGGDPYPDLNGHRTSTDQIHPKGGRRRVLLHRCRLQGCRLRGEGHLGHLPQLSVLQQQGAAICLAAHGGQQPAVGTCRRTRVAQAQRALLQLQQLHARPLLQLLRGGRLFRFPLRRRSGRVQQPVATQLQQINRSQPGRGLVEQMLKVLGLGHPIGQLGQTELEFKGIAVQPQRGCQAELAGEQLGGLQRHLSPLATGDRLAVQAGQALQVG